MADKFNQQEEYEAFKKLKQEQPKYLRGISQLWEQINVSIYKAADASNDLNKAHKDYVNISKSVLTNTGKIHEANVSFSDIGKEINKAIKSGNTGLEKRYKQMQQIQNYQKRYNNVVNAGANSIQKMVSSLESTIRGLPIIGDFIADAISFDDIGKNLVSGFRNQFAVGGSTGKAISDGISGMVGAGFVEGSTSGAVEAFSSGKKPFKVFRKSISKTFKGLKGSISGPFAKSLTPLYKGWNDFEHSFKGTGAHSKDMSFAWRDWGKNATKSVGGVGTGLTHISKLLGKGGIWGALAAGVVLLGSMAISATKFAFETGLSVGQAQKLGPALLINKKYVEATAEEFGNINDVNAKTAWALKKQKFFYGIQADQSVKILRIQTAISGQTSEQLINIQNQAAEAARTAGVLPVKLFEEISQNMEYFAKSAKDGGKNVMDTAIAAKELGVNLGIVDQIATHLLDIEGSINAQFEANAVLGKNMNFDRARQLVLAGKDHLLLAEIQKQVGGEAEFNKMNRIERELLSKAIGTDVTNLAKIATEQEKSGAKAKKSMAASTKWWMGIGAVILGALAFFTLPFSGAAALGIGALGALGGASLGMLGGATGILPEIPSFKGLSPGTGATIQSGAALGHAGETIIHREDLKNDEVLAETKRGNSAIEHLLKQVYRGIQELG